VFVWPSANITEQNNMAAARIIGAVK
jgi:hypothetical protein